MLFPNSKEEKQVQILAFKQDVITNNPNRSSNKCIYGAIVSEIWMSSFQKNDSSMSEEEFQNKSRQEWNNTPEDLKLTRIFCQFEDPDTHIYDVKLFSVLDPDILIEQTEEADSMVEGLNSMKEHVGLLSSLFNWTPKHNLDIIGMEHSTESSSLNIEEMLQFIKDTLTK
jgi:hypothetical protein